MSINIAERIDLAIVTKEPFPEGMAATNRILSYAKYLAGLKKVAVFIARPTEQHCSVKNAAAKGQVGALHFQYALDSTVWPEGSNKVIKFLVLLKSYTYLFFRLLRAKPRVILVYSSCYYLRLLVILVSKATLSRIYIEENEYPKRLKKKKAGLATKAYLSLYRKFNGMVVMTNELKSYYSSIGVQRIFVLPMTVDVSRFLYEKENEDLAAYGKYFCYVGGNGGMLRDGLLNMVTSFDIFQRTYSEYKFLIVGPIDIKNVFVKETMALIKDRALEEKVLFLGVKESKLVNQILLNAEGIVMTPQQNFSSGGFPTKLGEFLASGRPVVATDVGGLSQYLNVDSAFLVKAGDDTLVANAMASIVREAEQAKLVGEEGRKLAKKKFSIEAYAASFLSFIKLT